MRMSHYFLSLAVLAVGGLLATALAGVAGSDLHLWIALPTAIVVVGLHSLVIMFVLIGGRLLREGINNCGLDPSFLTRNNAYFKSLSGLFLTIGGAFSIVAAGVLGYAERAFSIPPEVHLIVGIGAAVITFLALPREYRALRTVEALLDETRLTLAAEDSQRAAEGLGPVDEDHVPYRDSQAHIGLFLITAPLLVYLYRALIVWRGRFERVDIHPWLEISLIGLVVWWLGKRKGAREGDAPDGGSSAERPETGAESPR